MLLEKNQIVEVIPPKVGEKRDLEVFFPVVPAGNVGFLLCRKPFPAGLSCRVGGSGLGDLSDVSVCH